MRRRSGAAYTVLLGVAAAGVLLWVATRVDGNATWRYWAALGVLAGAGLVFALSQRAGYSAWAGGTVPAFLLAFVPALIAAGWIAIAGMPHGSWPHDHVSSWSGDIGIGGLVGHLVRYVDVMAFGLGALLASAPGMVAPKPRIANPTVAEAPTETVPAAPPPPEGAIDEPVAASGLRRFARSRPRDGAHRRERDRTRV